MKVLVKRFATLQKGPGREPLAVHLAAGATVNDVLATLGIDPDEIGVLVINGRRATFAQELQENDLLTCIPQIGGG